MPQEFSLLGFVAHLHAVDRDIHDVGPAIVARACEMVARAAKRAIGKRHELWPPLKPATIARKLRGNTPLLETGELRDSIEWTASGLEGQVGSNNDKAVWHELGTNHIPPRSFLASSAISMEEKIHRMAERAVIAVLEGRGLHSAEMRELLHLLGRAYHNVKEAVEDALEDPDEKGRRK
jgi:phage gpG-like protein